MKFAWRWALCISALAVWTVLLLVPIRAEAIAPENAAFLKSLLPTLAHLLSYAVLTVLAGWLQTAPRVRIVLLLVLCGHAVITEIIQPYFGRDGSLADAGLDFLGIGLGLVLGRRYWLA